jgi:putative oxidoreductase
MAHVSYGLLFLRLVVGPTLSAHGAQKLFGWFGGGGPRGTGQMFGQLRFRNAVAFAVLAGLCEFVGGALVALGLLTPIGALLIVSVMLVAIATVHWPNGFFASGGGYEFNLLIVAASTALAATGPGRFSLDRALGWDDNLSGLWWGVGVLCAAAIGAALTLTLGREAAPPPAALPAEPEQSRRAA